MNDSHHRLERIDVRGIVQGVGFRPFVYNLAHNHNLYGYVQNNPDGVLIEAEGNSTNIEAFISDLQNHAPRLSRDSLSVVFLSSCRGQLCTLQNSFYLPRDDEMTGCHCLCLV